ncbi:MAG TPA: hypothetical protein VF550_01340 [Polyangia bacterium]
MANLKQTLTFALTFVLPLMSACSVMVDRTMVQCRTDVDCAKFETSNTAHVVCRQGTCASSGLGPQGCFPGTPATTTEYLNACTAAQTMPFSNCNRLGLCGAIALPDSEPPQSASALTPTIKAVAPPTVKCADAGPNVIYMSGTSDFGPLLKQVTPLLTANTPPYRPVFMAGTSCAGVSAVFDPTLTLIKDVPGTLTKAANYAYYFDDAGTQTSCSLDPAGNAVDIGVSNLYSSVCNPNYLPSATVAGYLGPVVTFGFTVPAVSTQNAISVEAAHIIFGLGGQNPVGPPAAPWTDPAYYSIRNSGAGSTALAAQLIRVPRTAFWGVDRLSTDAIRDSLNASAAPEQSIGILSIDYADKARGNLRVLFLQGEGQISGFLPDSTATSLNKANVRDGHYPLWGYVHFYTPNINGAPSAAGGAFVTRFSMPKLDGALVDAMIDASLVPQCVMKVARDTEMGGFLHNPNKYQCGCHFDYRTSGKSPCAPCATPNDCPASTPACNYGFCETE